MKARDVMVSPVITVGEDETVRDVAKLLIARRISAVPVVDRAGKIGWHHHGSGSHVPQ